MMGMSALVTVVAAPWTGGPSVIQMLALMSVLIGVVLASRATWRNLTRARGLWTGGAVGMVEGDLRGFLTGAHTHSLSWSGAV